MLKVGSCTAKKGQITKGFLTVAKGKKREYRIPVFIACGRKEGRTVFISAGNHGDEINGIYLLQVFMRKLRLKDLKGTIVFVPVVNPEGFWKRSRRVPQNHVDINRQYPGKKGGTIAQQIAYNLFEHVVKKCSFGLDLHDSGKNHVLLPHIRTHVAKYHKKSKNIDISVNLARYFGTEIVLERKGHPGMLSVAAFKELNIPVITVEIGGGLKIYEDFVRLGLQGIENVLSFYGMLQGKIILPRTQLILRNEQRKYYKAKDDGVLHKHVTLGDIVQKGEELAHIINPLTTRSKRIISRYDGVVIAIKAQSMIYEGEDAISLVPFHKGLRFETNRKSGIVEIRKSEIAGKAKRRVSSFK